MMRSKTFGQLAWALCFLQQQVYDDSPGNLPQRFHHTRAGEFPALQDTTRHPRRSQASQCPFQTPPRSALRAAEKGDASPRGGERRGAGSRGMQRKKTRKRWRPRRKERKKTATKKKRKKKWRKKQSDADSAGGVGRRRGRRGPAARRGRRTSRGRAPACNSR